MENEALQPPISSVRFTRMARTAGMDRCDFCDDALVEGIVGVILDLSVSFSVRGRIDEVVSMGPWALCLGCELLLRVSDLRMPPLTIPLSVIHGVYVARTPVPAGISRQEFGSMLTFMVQEPC